MNARPVLAALALAACAPKAPPVAPQPAPDDVWVIVHPSAPGLCVPWLGDPDDATLTAWNEAVARMQARDLPPLLAQAEARPADTPLHPALRAVDGITWMLAGDLETATVGLDALVAENGAQPCLLATSAAAQEMIGRTDEARKRIGLARSFAPDDPELALMWAYMGSLDEADDVLPVLEAGATAQPERVGFAIALGVAAITRGDPDGAIRWLEQAVAQGDPKVALMLLAAYRAAGRTDDYLRLASQMALPVPGDLGDLEAPLDTLLERWGSGGGEPVTVTLVTSLGDARCELFPAQAPITVSNFVGLATGTQRWLTPEGTVASTPLYDGLVFHRVIPEFMVQTGDPEGTGRGGPGYTFPDEVDPGLRFDRPGRLAMANSGPSSNGSQFFVTEQPTPHLDGRHTVFGQCDDEAVELVKRIARHEGEVALERVVVDRWPEEP